MNDKKQIKHNIKIMLFTFLVLVILSVAYCIYIYTFNHVPRESGSGETSDEYSVSIEPRTGQTDSWAKIINIDGQDMDYRGRIYDITVENTGNYSISKWELRIDVLQECFLNNAWCGTIEIHQKTKTGENVQTLDLRNYDVGDITVDYSVADPDLMIPLKKGDYLIYCPDFTTNEYPIQSGDNAKLTQVVFGMIFYDNLEQPLSFGSYHIKYYLQRKLFQSWQFVVLCVGFGLWFMMFVSFIAMEIGIHKAHVRFKEDEHIIRQSIGVFTRFFEAKDTYTRGHSQRVADYARMIAEKIGFNDDKCRQIYYISLMHDCGKCYIPDDILKKPGKLTAEEYEVIKSHTIKGAEMLEDFNSIEHIRDGVLYHHERYDGQGYPQGLKGEEIPLISRIICVADSFDAMNSQRCYRVNLTKEYIINEFKSNSGKQFDPKIAQAFLELVQEGKVQFAEQV